MTPELPLARRASRLLVVNEAGRILLFRYEDERGAWWATPGGGLEGDETFEEAAAREAAEELGLSDVSFTFQWERATRFRSRGRIIRQTERYFLAGPEAIGFGVGADVSQAHAVEGILATKWWSPAELRDGNERVFPEDLADRLDRILLGRM